MRDRLHRWPVLLVLLALVTAAGCTDRKKAVDLESVVVSGAPQGFEPQDGRFGPFDLERYLSEFSDAEAEDREILRRAGFRRGFARAWSDSTKANLLVAMVLEFGKEDGATSARDQFQQRSMKKKEAAPFGAERVSGSSGAQYVEDTEAGPQRIFEIFFTRGPRLYLVTSQSPHSRPNVALVTYQAEQQAAVAR